MTLSSHAGDPRPSAPSSKQVRRSFYFANSQASELASLSSSIPVKRRTMEPSLEVLAATVSALARTVPSSRVSALRSS